MTPESTIRCLYPQRGPQVSIAFFDRLADRLAELMCRPWSPTGRRVWIAFDDSRDAALAGLAFHGRIRATAVPDGLPTDLLVELEFPFTFADSSPIEKGSTHRVHARRLSQASTLREFAGKDEEIRWLVIRPCLRWRRTPRLRFSWSAARIIVAPSFAEANFERTIATGRIGLSKRSKERPAGREVSSELDASQPSAVCET